jgi:hypothetical protein
MTNTQLHNRPRFSHVLREQIRFVVLSLRLPLIGVAALGIVATGLVLIDFASGRGGVEFAPALSLIPAFAGILLPFAVWLSEKPFGPRLVWTLPVDRTRHAFAKVLAGWIVLIIAVTVFVLWLLIIALITKGNITGDETIRMLPSSIVPPRGTLDPSMLRTVVWIPQKILWLVPFTAATGSYLIASAVALGIRYPFRWIIGFIGATFVITAVGHRMTGDGMDLAVGRILETFFFGKYGVDALLSARAESFKTVVQLSTGDWVDVWRGLPVVSDWIIATILWTALGIAGLTAALMRHRERR